MGSEMCIRDSPDDVVRVMSGMAENAGLIGARGVVVENSGMFARACESSPPV